MTTDWKQQCIDLFRLLEVPSSSEESTPNNDDDGGATWKAYHDARVSWDQRKDRFESFQREPELLEQWEKALVEEAKKIKKEKDLEDSPMLDNWNKTVSMDIQGYIPATYADSGIQTVEYHAMIWSPYAIPRAVQVVHKYHRKPDWSKQEFSVSWRYRIIDNFAENAKEVAEDTTNTNNKMTTLCGCCYEDEELQADVINTDGVALETVKSLNECLLGSSTSLPTSVLDDLSFLKLLFASMATPDFRVLHDDGVNNFIGHTRKPEQGGFLRERLVEEGILDFESDEISTTWLEYHARSITNNLLPVDKYYKPFNIRDAPGYYAYQQKQKGR